LINMTDQAFSLTWISRSPVIVICLHVWVVAYDLCTAKCILYSPSLLAATNPSRPQRNKSKAPWAFRWLKGKQILPLGLVSKCATQKKTLDPFTFSLASVSILQSSRLYAPALPPPPPPPLLYDPT
jgi:hypothetical protein